MLRYAQHDSIRSGGTRRQELGGGVTCPVRGDSINQVRQEGPIMLLTGGADREHALRKATATGTLRAVTAFAPEHSRTQRPLGGVIGRLDPIRMQECPNSRGNSGA